MARKVHRNGRVGRRLVLLTLIAWAAVIGGAANPAAAAPAQAPSASLMSGTYVETYPYDAAHCRGNGIYDHNNNTGGGGSISRAAIIQRADSWVADSVRYCTGQSYRNQYGTYRTDCSGFVAMAWGLSTEFATGTVRQYSGLPLDFDFAWSSLQRGDAIIKEGSHVMLFYDWIDAPHTMYVVQEPSYPDHTYKSPNSVQNLQSQGYTTMRYRNATSALPPAVSSYTVTAQGVTSPTNVTLPSQGGTVVLNTTLTNGSTVTFSSDSQLADLPATKDASDGSASHSVAVPANLTSSPKTYTLSLTATGPGGTVPSTRHPTITVQPTPPPVITSFVGTGGGSTSSAVKLPRSGGTVTLKATIQNASSATFTSSPTLAFPPSTPISSGAAVQNVTVAANATSERVTYTVNVRANGPGGPVNSSNDVTITVLPSTPSSMILWDNDNGNYVVHSWFDFSSTYRGGGTWAAGYDQLIPGDWDGDGRADDTIMWVGANGNYVVHTWSNFGWIYKQNGTWSTVYDQLIPGDWDGDGRANDMILWDRDTGNYVVHSWNNFTSTYRGAGTWSTVYDKLIAGDWDGDGRTNDTITWDNDTGNYVVHSWSNFSLTYKNRGTWALGYDELVPADLDGDNQADDMLLWATASGDWVVHSWTNFAPTYRGRGTWSSAYKHPVPADWDADGLVDDILIWGKDTYMHWAVHSFSNFTSTLQNAGNWSAGYDQLLVGQFAG